MRLTHYRNINSVCPRMCQTNETEGRILISEGFKLRFVEKKKPFQGLMLMKLDHIPSCEAVLPLLTDKNVKKGGKVAYIWFKSNLRKFHKLSDLSISSFIK